MINEMENIAKVKITLGDSPSIAIERTHPVSIKRSTPSPAVEPPKKEPSYPGFTTAQDTPPSPPAPVMNLATEGQRKYADDLAKKLGEKDMMNVVYGLAHALGIPAEDILHPDQWLESLTREHANSYLDVLEQQYKKMRRSAF